LADGSVRLHAKLQGVVGGSDIISPPIVVSVDFGVNLTEFLPQRPSEGPAGLTRINASADPRWPHTRMAARRLGTRATRPPVPALPGQNLALPKAVRRRERIKLLATPGEGFGGIRHHRASPLPCHENHKSLYPFRDTKTSLEMKPCVGSRTRLRASPAGAGPELMAETQARVEWAARDEPSARGL
jgi:hypothetical protein